MTLVERIVAACTRAPLLVVLIGVVLGLGSGWYTAGNFNMDTDSTKLISPKVEWRQREIHFDSLFPQQVNLIAVVVDGATPELAEAGTAALTDALTKQKKLFSVVRRPDGGDFFSKNGLLFLSYDEVKANTEEMIQAAPFLGPMAADPSLRGIMSSLQTALMGIEHGDAKLADIDRPMKAFGAVLNRVANGEKTWLSWRSMVTAGTLSGSFEASTALRPTWKACSPPWLTQPMMTSSIAPGSTPVRATIASSTAPPRSAGCQPARRPPLRPPAVRAAATI